MRFEDVIKTTKFQSENAKSQLNVIHTGGVLECYYNIWFAQFGLTTHQYNVLRIVRGQAPKSVTVKNISDRLVHRNSNTTRIIDKLAEKNLITREDTSPDRRAVHVVLTPKGIELLSKIDDVMLNDNPHLVALDESEASVLSKLLDKMREAFDASLASKPKEKPKRKFAR